MEFHETLQQLRKQKGLTQEDLAEALFVSRTAVSKWESGRGFPNLDSLKAISVFFDVSVDGLLSGEALLAIARNERQEQAMLAQDLAFGLLDIGASLLAVLPLFGQLSDGRIDAVLLSALTDVQPYMKGLYIALIAATVVFGIVTLALQSCRRAGWLKIKRPVSIALTIACTCLFAVSRQSYAAVFTLACLVAKMYPTKKRR